MGEKERIGNEVTERARTEVRFCFHFSFSRSPFLVLVLYSSLTVHNSLFIFVYCPQIVTEKNTATFLLANNIKIIL